MTSKRLQEKLCSDVGLACVQISLSNADVSHTQKLNVVDFLKIYSSLCETGPQDLKEILNALKPDKSLIQLQILLPPYNGDRLIMHGSMLKRW